MSDPCLNLASDLYVLGEENHSIGWSVFKRATDFPNPLEYDEDEQPIWDVEKILNWNEEHIAVVEAA